MSRQQHKPAKINTAEEGPRRRFKSNDKRHWKHSEYVDDCSKESGDADSSRFQRHDNEEETDTKAPPLVHDAPRRRPQTTIDWRSEIRRCLDKPHDISDHDLLDALDEASDTLQEIEQLRNQASAQRAPPRFEIIHRISCQHNRTEQGYFLDPPSVVNYGPHDAHARSSRRIPSIELFLERNKEITCLVYREYECCGTTPPARKLLIQKDTDDMSAKALFINEYVHIVSSDLLEAMISLGKSMGDIPITDLSGERPFLRHPYTWWYHRRGQIEAFAVENPELQEHIDVFARYLKESLEKEWEVVDKLLADQRITAEYLHYLFVPNEVIISTLNGSDAAKMEGFLLWDWAEIQHSQYDRLTVKLDTSYWTFDGKFGSRRTCLRFYRVPSEPEDFAITELAVYPQKYASPETVRALRKRGEMLWRCRERHYVSSITHSDYGLQETVNSRFMVDMRTYHEMHPSSKNDTPHIDKKRVYLDAELMSKDQPDLGDDFFLCLPTVTFGYNMQKHEWVSLSVADLRDVEWNENAFELLVLEPTTKELVEAVVTHRILADEQTDVIQGKGNGLFILLHGGPGTGKTLTAESVAEVAKRPLYRVTCGDIGTKAEEVEKYLESVLMLGKVWECVVLLDEADVFLEKRSLHHLERNALVSVFLRVLEYYDGILILTSNRVGTFDEAFKSRIQLSLRYRDLDRDQRQKIWANFITRLETLDTSNKQDPNARVEVSSTRHNVEVGIDTAGIRASLGKLAEYELNGREIRNTISTARQLAMFRKERMNFGHLDRVIGEASKFQEYTKELNQGFTADEISRHRGER